VKKKAASKASYSALLEVLPWQLDNRWHMVCITQ